LLQCEQMHTPGYNYNNVLIHKHLQVLAHTGPSSESTHLHKTIVQPFYHSQHMEMLQVHQCENIAMEVCTENYKNCKTLDYYNYIYKGGHKAC
jgi:hypothetical protein